MDQHYQVDLIMLDFSKAFDTLASTKQTIIKVRTLWYTVKYSLMVTSMAY